jgi:hypothetical protein
MSFSRRRRFSSSARVAAALVVVALVLPAAAHAGFGSLSAVSVRADGGATGNATSQRPAGSADGHAVAFESSATNLMAGASDTNGDFDIFLRNRVAGTTALVSHAATSSTTAADAGSSTAIVSADGRWVAYMSQADDLVAGQTADPNFDHILLYDSQTGANVLVDHSAAAVNQVGDGRALRDLHVGCRRPDGRSDGRERRDRRVRVRPHGRDQQARDPPGQ